MTSKTVVLAGRFSLEHLGLEAIVAEFGWTLKEVDSLQNLASLADRRQIAAVLFHPATLDLTWEEALSFILDEAPGALPILCHGFAEAIDWPLMADAGAFHSLLLPFSVQEVRQSLGFISSARSRSAVISIRQGMGVRTAGAGQTTEVQELQACASGS